MRALGHATDSDERADAEILRSYMSYRNDSVSAERPTSTFTLPTTACGSLLRAAWLIAVQKCAVVYRNYGNQ